jgi:hypothetical protein
MRFDLYHRLTLRGRVRLDVHHHYDEPPSDPVSGLMIVADEPLDVPIPIVPIPPPVQGAHPVFGMDFNQKTTLHAFATNKEGRPVPDTQNATWSCDRQDLFRPLALSAGKWDLEVITLELSGVATFTVTDGVFQDKFEINVTEDDKASALNITADAPVDVPHVEPIGGDKPPADTSVPAEHIAAAQQGG